MQGHISEGLYCDTNDIFLMLYHTIIEKEDKIIAAAHSTVLYTAVKCSGAFQLMGLLLKMAFQDFKSYCHQYLNKQTSINIFIQSCFQSNSW